MSALGAPDLYGRGLSFPIRVGLDGRLAVSEGEPNVRECICVLLRTLRVFPSLYSSLGRLSR